MTVQTLPWSIQGQSHSAEIARNLSAAIFGAPVAAFTNAVSPTTHGGSHGVVGAGDLAVTQNGTPNMSVNVAAGRALVRAGNASSIAAGVWAVMNDATVNVAISAADPTNPRIDLVVIQVRDTNYGEAASDARITVVTGTPAASPVAPALTSHPNAVVLAQVAVAAATTTIVTGNITDRRPYAVALGGTYWCSSTTRPTGVALRDGLRIYELDTRRSYIYQSTAATWVTANEVIVCTSGTRPTSPLFEGLIIMETDTNNVLVYDGAAWQYVAPGTVLTWTPTLTNITIGTSVVTASYTLDAVGKRLVYNFFIGAGTATATGVADCRFTIPAGLTSIATAIQPQSALLTGSTVVSARVDGSSTQVRFWKTAAAGNFAAADSVASTAISGVVLLA